MSEPTKENPPAFPQGNEWMDMEGNMRLAHEGGMTLRDWFAGQALIGLLTGGKWRTDELADQSYAAADAMLAARKGETQ